LPFVWRGWYDFGGGALGDMGCYSFDTIFRALKLGAPASVDASCTERYDETFPKASIIHFDFPARGEMPPVRLTWYDGGLKPARSHGWEDDRKMDAEGLLFVGDRGAILCGFNGRGPRLLPEAKMKEYKRPPKTLTRSPGHQREWLDACMGGKAKPGANFEFSAGVTEALLLGNVALRTGQRLIWDSTHLKAVNVASAEQYIRPERRKDWNL
jgi:predicted dehydrogenase